MASDTAINVRTITFRCPEPLHEALRALAFTERTSIQRLMEEALALHLSRRATVEDRPPPHGFDVLAGEEAGQVAEVPSAVPTAA